jgi:uncharacterized protein (DUF1501 family)
MDGLAAVPPVGDRDYRGTRGGLALSGSIVSLEGFFGLHPALAPLHTFYAARQMIVMPAVATVYAEQRHAAGRAYLDHGNLPADTGDWLDRAQELLTHSDRTAGTVWREPSRGARSDVDADMIANLCHRDPALAQLLATHGCNADVATHAHIAGFRSAAIEAGQALATSGGPRLAQLESFGWDTHADQGADTGKLATALAGLADGLVALSVALGDAWRHTVVLVATEFGRSVRMNSMGGTDHGVASAALMLGGAVAGGRVVGNWPGLAVERLHRGRDLMPTLDLHAVATAALVEHLCLPRATVEQFVLPGQGQPPSLGSLFLG